MVSYDFHMHSSFSEDSDTPMEEMIESAACLGLKGICFTEHMDLDFPPEFGNFCFDPVPYGKKILECRDKYGSRIEILMGIELGMQPHLQGRLKEAARQMPYDFIIASQHLVGGRDPYYPESWSGFTADSFMRIYYENMLADIRMMPDFDTLAHLDYCTRYVPEGMSLSGPEAFMDLIDQVLTELIRRGKCLEVNTSGYRSASGSPNPCEAIIRRYLELGGTRFTIGSDAHTPENISGHFEDAAALLKGLGVDSYQIFRKRVPYTVSL